MKIHFYFRSLGVKSMWIDFKKKTEKSEFTKSKSMILIKKYALNPLQGHHFTKKIREVNKNTWKCFKIITKLTNVEK